MAAYLNRINPEIKNQTEVNKGRDVHQQPVTSAGLTVSCEDNVLLWCLPPALICPLP